MILLPPTYVLLWIIDGRPTLFGFGAGGLQVGDASSWKTDNYGKTNKKKTVHNTIARTTGD